MRKLITTAALAVAGLLAFPNTSSAEVHCKVGHSHSYISGHASCGCPIYTKKVFHGYNRYNRPLYKYYRQPFRHNSKFHVSHRRGNYSRHGYYSPRRQYSYGRSYYRGRGHYNSSRRGYGYRSRGYHSRGGYGYRR